ncbi:MAG: SIMPL domain-containing protein [Halocynthiibacter sp.]
MADTPKNTLGLAILGAFLAIGLAISGYFVSNTILVSRIGANTASVKGLSERIVEAGRFELSTSFYERHNGKDVDRNALYERAERTAGVLKRKLYAAGLTEAEMKSKPVGYRRIVHTDRNGHYTGETHQMTGGLSINSSNVNIAEQIHGILMEAGAREFSLEVGDPQYHFTGLNKIKPDMLREATANARIAADEFAKNAGVSVGSIQSARQGGFTVRDASNENSERYDKQKKVRVVSTITFYLKN